MGPIERYITARRDVLHDDINDIIDAAKNGYWQEVIHFIGAESPSILSQRMEIRRAWARQQVLNPGAPKPSLPKITSTTLSTK